ncbi:HAD-IA family hydrolase [Streptomyces sp. NBC_01288]|uniref:HAD family hydrolase n=1 Tax=Streptomyces sp. NBC_01288 TaxID=2903814 RepID=UPI002E1022E0|nr:HAD-IA family hydrolase [Streptomyces sp. NBC_01288]
MTKSVVLWDFDGTLAFRGGRWRGCLVEALDEVAPGHGVVAADVAPGLRDGFPWHRSESGHPELSSPDAWWGDLQPLFVKAYVGAGVEAGPAALAASRVRAHYIDASRWAVFPDSLAALEELAAAGWLHVVVSNHVPELDGLLRDLGLGRHFAAVVNSSLVGWEKPHRRIFEVALERAGSPERVWMVGDNPVADVVGAQALGIPAILVSPAESGLQPAVRRILNGDVDGDVDVDSP